MKSHTGSRLGFDEGPSTAGFTAAVITLFVIVLPQDQNFMFVIVLCGQLHIHKRGIFLVSFFLSTCIIQHCLICCPSDSTASEDAGTETRTVATLALTARRS
jgi:hypothetical protein